MAAEIPDTEPIEITAGDTVKWIKSLPDYLATDAWVLSYAITGRLSRPGVMASVASGGNFAVTIPAATTAIWIAGDYTIIGYVAKATERFTVYEGKLKVKPNLSAATGLYDDRSDAKIAYDNAMAIWQNVKSHGSYSIAGRTYTSRNMVEILALIDRCKADYNREQIKEKFAKTGINPRHMRVRFNR